MSKDFPKYIWIVVPQNFQGDIDIRRYAFSHPQAVWQLKHCQRKYGSYKDCASKGIWTLFKLVQVNKRRTVRLSHD